MIIVARDNQLVLIGPGLIREKKLLTTDYGATPRKEEVARSRMLEPRMSVIGARQELLSGTQRVKMVFLNY
jgi:hypothetical protein